MPSPVSRFDSFISQETPFNLRLFLISEVRLVWPFGYIATPGNVDFCLKGRISEFLANRTNGLLQIQLTERKRQRGQSTFMKSLCIERGIFLLDSQQAANISGNLENKASPASGLSRSSSCLHSPYSTSAAPNFSINSFFHPVLEFGGQCSENWFNSGPDNQWIELILYLASLLMPEFSVCKPVSQVSLIQPEMEKRRSPLVSIPPFGRGFFKAWGLSIRWRLGGARTGRSRPRPSSR